MSFGNAGVTHTPFSFFTPSYALVERLFDDDGKVLLLLLVLASPRYMKTVTNGACPFVVISVTT